MCRYLRVVIAIITVLPAIAYAKWSPACSIKDCPVAADVISCSSRSCSVLGTLDEATPEPQVLQTESFKEWEPASFSSKCPTTPFKALSWHPRNAYAAVTNDGKAQTTTVAINSGEQTPFECLHTFPGTTVDIVPVHRGIKSGFLLLVLSADPNTPHSLVTVPLDGSAPTTRYLPDMESLPARVTAATNGVLFVLAHTLPASEGRLAVDLVDGCLRRDPLHCIPVLSMNPYTLMRLNFQRSSGTQPKSGSGVGVNADVGHELAFELWSSEDAGRTWGRVARERGLALTSIDCTQGEDSLLCVGGGLRAAEAILAYSTNSGFSWNAALHLSEQGAAVSDVAIAPEGMYAVAVGTAGAGVASVWMGGEKGQKWSVAVRVEAADPFVSLTMTPERLLGHTVSPHHNGSSLIYAFSA